MPKIRPIFPIFIILLLLGLILPSSPPKSTLAQSAETLTPRFGKGVAIIKRPDSLDLYFTAHLTDDGQTVIGYSTNRNWKIYVWDISELGDDILYNDPEIIDLTTFLPQEYSGDLQMMFQSDTRLIVHYYDVLLQIDILTEEVISRASLAATFPDGIPLLTSLSAQNDTVALFFDETDTIVVWDTVSNQLTAHPFDEPISGVSPFRDGWHITQINYGAAYVNFFCDLSLETCHRDEIWGNLALDTGDVLIFGDTFAYSDGTSFAPTYYTFDPTTGLSPTETPFPNLPENVLPVSLSPDGQFMMTLTYDENFTSGGMIPARAYEVWGVDGTEALYSIGRTYRPYWFRDHFIGHSPNAEIATLSGATSQTNLDRFSIYEMRGNNGLPDDGLYDFLGGYPEMPHLYQISADGTRYLHILGGAAIVLPIEYQPIDDLLRVEDTIFSVDMEGAGLSQTYLSPDGQMLVSLNPDTAQLTRWEVDSGDSASFDLSSFLTEDSVFDFALRDDDLFLQIDNVLRHISSSDLAILDEFSVGDTLTDFPAYSVVVRDQPSVAVNGDVVAALFDNSTVLWRDGEFSVVDIGGMRLYPLGDGWIIYRVDYSVEPDLHELTRCDLMLENCTVGKFDGPLASIQSKELIVGGNSLLGFVEFGIPPSYWQLNPDSITPTDPVFELPSEHYVPASFHDDYALVAAPAYDYDGSGRHYELWSISDSHRITRLIFRGDWAWHGDFAFVTNDRHLTIVHLPDGRFTRWSATSPISRLDLSADGSRLLVTTADTLYVLRLRA